MRVDAATGFVDRSRFAHGWLAGAAAHMQRDFTPEQLWRILARNRFEGCVTAALLDQPEEVDWLLGLASAHDFVLGVVGGGGPADWDRWQRETAFRGVVLEAPDTEAAGEAARRGLAIEITGCAAAAKLAEDLPEAQISLAHMGRPSWRPEDFAVWASAMEDLARAPNVYVKISGLINDAGPEGWRAATYRPWIDHLIGHFGPDRLMYGSDWPRCMHSGTWKEHLAAFTQAMGARTEEFREKILGGTAARFYGLGA